MFADGGDEKSFVMMAVSSKLLNSCEKFSSKNSVKTTNCTVEGFWIHHRPNCDQKEDFPKQLRLQTKSSLKASTFPLLRECQTQTIKRFSIVSEGKAMATAYDCKFIESSVTINHNVVSIHRFNYVNVISLSFVCLSLYPLLSRMSYWLDCWLKFVWNWKIPRSQGENNLIYSIATNETFSSLSLLLTPSTTNHLHHLQRLVPKALV